MIIKMECLKDTIGITNTNCLCIIDGLTPEQLENIRVSKSGLYLDDLPGGLSLSAIKLIDACSDFAEMGLKAKETAVKTFGADLLTAISQKYKTGKNAFVGNIGRPSYASTLNISQQYQYVKIQSKEVSDAVLKLTGLNIIVDRDDTLTVKILRAPYNGNQAEELHTFEVDVEANKFKSVPLGSPLMFPLSANNQIFDYYFVWSSENGARPKDLQLDCNCSNSSFGDYIIAKGGELGDLSMLSDRSEGKYSQGISLDVDIRCVPGDLICRNYDAENAIAVVIAWALLFKAGELLIEYVMSSSEVNRYTMLNREFLWGKRNHFKKEYENRVLYLKEVIDVSSSDCFICRDAQMILGGIMS